MTSNPLYVHYVRVPDQFLQPLFTYTANQRVTVVGVFSNPSGGLSGTGYVGGGFGSRANPGPGYHPAYFVTPHAAFRWLEQNETSVPLAGLDSDSYLVVLSEDYFAPELTFTLAS